VIAQSRLGVAGDPAAPGPHLDPQLTCRRIGSLLPAHGESVDTAFSMVAGGTECDGAILELGQIPATGTCRSCAASFDVSEAWEACPDCGQAS
jgi:hydrogenase nickel incorporation protein HypA/HybF